MYGNGTTEQETTAPEYDNVETTKYDDIELIDPEEYGIMKRDADPLYEHQKKMIAAMAEAELSPPIVTNDGGEYFSCLGVNACNPGSGKTAAMLALALMIPELDPPEVRAGRAFERTHTSALVSITAPNTDERVYIPTTVILAPLNLSMAAWVKNYEKFFSGKFYYMESFDSMQKSNLKQGGTFGNDLEEEMALLTKRITSLRGKKNRNTITPSERTALEEAELRKAELKTQKTRKSARVKYDNDAVIEYIVEKMMTHPIVICPASQFAALIPVFRKYTITRLIIDEPQAIVLTNQSDFIGSATNELIEYTVKSDRALSSMRELSCARMIWLVTGTPHQLKEQEKGHFVNTWIARNAPFLKDYANAITGDYKFPEMIERYIIKFPRDIIERNIHGGVKWGETVILHIRRPQLMAVLNGVVDDSLLALIEDDRLDELLTDLKLKDVKMDDPNVQVKIVNAVITRYRRSVSEIENKTYERSNRAIEENNEERLKSLKEKITTLERRLSVMEKLRELVRTGEVKEGELVCQICLEEVKLGDTIVLCPRCFNLWHESETMDYLSTRANTRGGVKMECPNCKLIMTGPNRPLKINLPADSNPDEIEITNEPEEESFASKLEAVRAVLGSEDAPRKTLLFLSSGRESVADTNVVKAIAAMGIEVIYQTNMTERQKADAYGANASHIHNIGDRKNIQNMINRFRDSKKQCVFIMRTDRESFGLDFEFADAAICYSKPKTQDMAQIVGRFERPGRNHPFTVYILEYKD
jgi:hypothetical protein